MKDPDAISGIVQFIGFVSEGNVHRVETILQSQPELATVTVSYADEHRAIHYAVQHRQPSIVRLLMQYGANARAGIHPHRDATSAWTMAHERGYHDIVAIIEEEARRGVDSETDSNAEPPASAEQDRIRTAVISGDLPFLQALQAEGKLTNPVHWREGGLLTLAVTSNREHVLRFLLDCGLHPDEPAFSANGTSVATSAGHPLWQAAALGHLELARLLLNRGANPNVHVDSSGSAVHSAWSHKQWPMVELLREHGGVVTGDTVALYRETDLARQMLDDGDRGRLHPLAKGGAETLAEEMLRFAAEGGAVEIMRMLLPRIPWLPEDSRWFGVLSGPLFFWHHVPWLEAGNKSLDRQSYLACFRLILSACGSNLTGAWGQNILHEIAAARPWVNDDEVAMFAAAALESGVSVNVRDRLLRSTPLGWACRWGRATLVRLLLDHGADRDEADAPTWARPRAWARTMGHHAILDLLA